MTRKQTVVIKVSMDGNKSLFGVLDGQKARSKALKIAVGLKGVVSAALKGQEKDQIEVKGDSINILKLATLLRKKVGPANIVTVEEEKKDEKKGDGEKKNEPTVQYMVWPNGCSVPSYSYPFYEVRDYYDPYPCSIMYQHGQ